MSAGEREETEDATGGAEGDPGRRAGHYHQTTGQFHLYQNQNVYSSTVSCFILRKTGEKLSTDVYIEVVDQDHLNFTTPLLSPCLEKNLRPAIFLKLFVSKY